MKNNVWFLLVFLIVPCLLAGQNLSTPTDADTNYHSLIAFTKDTLKDDNPPMFIQLDEMPQVINRVNTEYPKSALKDSVEGRVAVKVLVGEKGDVIKAIIAKGDREDFCNAAVEAIKKWKFKPGMIKGKPVASWVVIPFDFKLFKDKEKQSKNNAYPDKVAQSITELVDFILKGKDIEQIKKKNVDPNAYLIFDNQFVSLYGVLNGEHKSIDLTQEPGSEIRSPLIIKPLEDETNAFLFLKTQNKKGGRERSHTILFAKSSTGEWKITHWHVSF
ncbi:MAG: energy transducer TonB [Bacteroidetes bacterium]|nr:energy transducer TonB [Bacteroidota bacterium]